LSSAYRADICVGWISPGVGLTGTEDFAICVELDVDL
jgi:hypothetical protein